MSEEKQGCDHFSHYRQRQDLPDRATGKIADYTMTCTECGHMWTAPAPTLEVEVFYEVRAEATIDLPRYFESLSEMARKEYAALAAASTCGSE